MFNFLEGKNKFLEGQPRSYEWICYGQHHRFCLGNIGREGKFHKLMIFIQIRPKNIEVFKCTTWQEPTSFCRDPSHSPNP